MRNGARTYSNPTAIFHNELEETDYEIAVQAAIIYSRNRWPGDDEFESIAIEAVATAAINWDEHRGPWPQFCSTYIKQCCKSYHKWKKFALMIESRWRPPVQEESIDTCSIVDKLSTPEKRGLAHMRWYHGFTLQQMAAATGKCTSYICGQLDQIVEELQCLEKQID